MSLINTIIGFIHKLYESSRKLHLMFTHMIWGEYQELRITNVGQKPIEIIEVGVQLTKNIHLHDPYNKTPIFPVSNESTKLPTRLLADESVVFRFQLDQNTIFKKNSYYCFAKDSIGKKYKTTKTHFYDLKYHHDIPEKDMRKLIK